jgi:hypothetical protein
MNKRGQVGLCIPGTFIGAAFLLSVVQAVAGEEVTIPSYVWDVGRWVIVLLVGVVAWFLRQTFREHDERLKTLERRQWQLSKESKREQLRHTEKRDGS